MTAVYAGVAIPVLEDILAYSQLSTTVPAGFSVDAGPPKKIKGDYQASRTYIRPMITSMSQTKKWTVMTVQVDLTGTSSGESVEFATSEATNSSGLYLEWVRVSDTEVKVRLGKKTIGPVRTTLGTSTTTYTQGTTITVRIESDGTIVKVWINGITSDELEIDITDSLLWHTLQLVTPDDADFTHWWWLMGMRGGDTGADRPNVDVTGPLLYPVGDYGGGLNDYGDQSDCTTAVGSYARWDDYSGSTTHDGATTYNCGDATSVQQEISTLSTVAVARTPDGVTTRAFARALPQLKTANTDMVLRDEDGNQDIKANINVSQSVWTSRLHDWATPPDGAWADFVYSGIFNHASATHQLSIGVQHPNTNNSNDHWTAIAVILGSIGNDPEVVADNRRRVGAQVI